MFNIIRRRVKKFEDSGHEVMVSGSSVVKDLKYDEVNILDFYTLTKNYSYALIYVDKSGQKVYDVIEPILSDTEKSLLNIVRQRIFENPSVTKELRNLTNVEVGIEVIRNAILNNILNVRITDTALADKISYYVARDLIGYSVIDPLIRDPRLEDIVCAGVDIPIYVFHSTYEWLRTNIVLQDVRLLETIIRRLMFRAGLEVNIAKPIVDGVIMPEGYRVHVAIDVVSRRGSTFTIRKFKAEPYTIIDLINLRTLDPLVAAYLWMLVENLQSILIVGPTASGKTTLLNAIALLLPPEIKVVTVEESPEINLLGHENWISLITRVSTEEGVVNITLYDLLKSALRQRPDVVVVGELRGEESYTFFQAVSLGHGGLATIHAENVGAALQRLLAEPFNIPKYLLQLVKVYIGLGKVEVGEGIGRRVLEVKEVEGLDPRTGELVLSTVFRWIRGSDAIVFTGYSHVIKSIAERKQVSYDEVFNDLLRRATLMKWLTRRNVSISELQNIIRTYMTNWLTIYSTAESEVGPYEVPR